MAVRPKLAGEFQKIRLTLLYLLFTSRGMLFPSESNSESRFFRPQAEWLQQPRRYFSGLEPAEQKALEEFWGRDGLNQLFSLAEESDWELMQGDLLDLGRRLRKRDRLPAALLIFQFLGDHAETDFQASKAESRRELDAMVGRGSLGPRMEFFSEIVARQLKDPVMWAAMWADQWAFAWARRGTAMHLMQKTAEGAYEMRRGGWALANLSGFSMEVPAYVLTQHSLRHLLDLSPYYGSLQEGLGGAFLVRGGMWFGGALGRGLTILPLKLGGRVLGRWGLGLSKSSRWYQGISGTGEFFGGYLGTVVGGGLEMARAYHLPFSLDALFAESLTNYMQFRALHP